MIAITTPELLYNVRKKMLEKEVLKMVKYKRWTPAAIECYNRGCICNGCFYNQFFTEKHQKCHMKESVLQLVKDLGLHEQCIKKSSIIELG